MHDQARTRLYSIRFRENDQAVDFTSRSAVSSPRLPGSQTHSASTLCVSLHDGVGENDSKLTPDENSLEARHHNQLFHFFLFFVELCGV